MKNKKKIIFILLIILIPATWFIFFNNSTEDLSEMFIIKDTSVVFEVSISNDVKNVNIKKINKSNKWYVNDKYEANEKSVKRLIQALKEVKINRPVKKEKLDSVITTLEEKGTAVYIFDKKGNKIKSWIIGAYKESAKGTYMMDTENKQAFIVNIPGLENDLNYRYNINSIYWIKTELFSYQPSEIKEIEIIYNNTPSKSFRLVIENDKVQLFSHKSKIQLEGINYNNVGSYLSYFMNVKFSSFYDFKNEERDSLLNAAPEYIIILKDTYNITKNVKLFLIKDMKDPNKFNLNKMNAVINNEDPVIVKYYDIDLILKDIEYFIN